MSTTISKELRNNDVMPGFFSDYKSCIFRLSNELSFVSEIF